MFMHALCNLHLTGIFSKLSSELHALSTVGVRANEWWGIQTGGNRESDNYNTGQDTSHWGWTHWNAANLSPGSLQTSRGNDSQLKIWIAGMKEGLWGYGSRKGRERSIRATLAVHPYMTGVQSWGDSQESSLKSPYCAGPVSLVKQPLKGSKKRRALIRWTIFISIFF